MLDFARAFDVIAGFASILGLVFSYLAWQKAKLAVVAAQEARKSVRRGNAREELNELNEQAKSLLQFSQQDQRSEALVISARLLSGMLQAGSRWARFLGEEGATRIRTGAKKVEKISFALSKGGTGLTPEEREKVLEFCHNVVALMAEESGKMMERMDGENIDG